MTLRNRFEPVESPHERRNERILWKKCWSTFGRFEQRVGRHLLKEIKIRVISNDESLVRHSQHGADSRELTDGRLKRTRDKYNYVGRAEIKENHTDKKRSPTSRKENYFTDPRADEYRRREINS